MHQYTIDDFREGKVIVKIDPDNNSDVLRLRKLVSLACPLMAPEALPRGTNIYYVLKKYFPDYNPKWYGWLGTPTDELPIVSVNEISMENTKFKFGDLLDVTFHDATSIGEYTYVAPIPGDLHIITRTLNKISQVDGRFGGGTLVRTVSITAIRHSTQVNMTKKEIEEKLCLSPGSLKIIP